MAKATVKKLSTLGAILVALTANADEGEQRIYVDLDEVVAAGKVAPMDGITSSGQPNEAALNVFAASGYSTVIDLRGPNEDRGMDDFQGVVQATGMTYVAFPVTAADQISFATASELDAMLQNIEGPVLLHCGSGDRVGAVLALRASLAGADNDAAIALGRDAGMKRLEPTVREVLQAE